MTPVSISISTAGAAPLEPEAPMPARDRTAPRAATAPLDRIAAGTYAGAAAGSAIRAVPRPRATGAGYAPAKAAAPSSTKASTAAKATSSTKSAATAKTSTSSTSSTTTSTSTSSSSSSALKFLDDKKLTIEDKLMKFIALVSQRADADIVAKMKEIEATQAAKTTSTASSASSSTAKAASPAVAKATAAPTTTAAPRKKKGLLGSVFDAVKVVFPVVGLNDFLLNNKTVSSVVRQVTGPVLAAGASAIGLPEAAPALLKAGPDLFDAAKATFNTVASALGGSTPASSGTSSGSGSSSGGTSSGTTSSSSTSGAAAKSEELQMMELQRLLEKEKEMMTAVSNTLRALHDMRMNAIQNLR